MQEELETLPSDQLWTIYKEIEITLSAKLEAEARIIDKRLAALRPGVRMRKARPVSPAVP